MENLLAHMLTAIKNLKVTQQSLVMLERLPTAIKNLKNIKVTRKRVVKILVRTFAVIGVIMTLSILIGAYSVRHWLTTVPAPPEAPANMVLDLDFTHPIVEKNRELVLSLSALLQEEEEIPLFDIVRALERAKDDPRVKGVVARFGSEQPSLVHAQEIRAALLRFRQSGKFTYVFAPNYGSFGPGNRTYYLASAFENIWLQPVGTVGLTGLGIEAPFGKTALGNIGVHGDFLRREEYKSVMENVTRDEFSPAVRANMESMLKNLGEQEAKGIAENRNMDLPEVRELMAGGPYTAPEALNAELVTHIGYMDEMLKVAELLATDVKSKAETAPVRVTPSTYLSFKTKAKKPKATIALINGLGLITDAPSSGPSRLAEDHIIDTEKLVKAFAEAAADKGVKAILFRVDSPGGSPSASESIRHALIKAKAAKKPVFVSMGEVAASGGYWISMDANHIVAEPGTITGSIGVVAGKFVLGDLWEKLGIKWDSLVTSDNAKLWSSLAPFSPHDRDRINALLDDTYQAFTKNVSVARKIPLEKISDIAKGRVWTGEQALKVGLVDELGGIETTVLALKKELKLAPTDPIALKQFPPPESPSTIALRLLRNIGFESAMVRAALGLLQKVITAAGPMWDEMEDTGAVSARVPAEMLRVVK